MEFKELLRMMMNAPRAVRYESIVPATPYVLLPNRDRISITFLRKSSGDYTISPGNADFAAFGQSVKAGIGDPVNYNVWQHGSITTDQWIITAVALTQSIGWIEIYAPP